MSRSPARAAAYPSAAVLVELAQPFALREEFVSPGPAPLYLRTPMSGSAGRARRRASMPPEETR